MDYEIRLGKVEDCHELAVLKQKVWNETYRGIYDDEIIDNFDYIKSENKFKNIILNDDMSLYVVESNGRLVGYMHVGTPLREYLDYEQEIGLLYLTCEFHGRGIGRELFNIAYKKIKNSGYKKFFISCNKYNEKARTFYLKMGGVIIYEDEASSSRRYDQVKFNYNIN